MIWKKYNKPSLLLTLISLVVSSPVSAQPIPSPEQLGVQLYQKPLQFEYVEMPSDHLNGWAIARDPETGKCKRFEIKNGQRATNGEITDEFECRDLDDPAKEPKDK